MKYIPLKGQLIKTGYLGIVCLIRHDLLLLSVSCPLIHIAPTCQLHVTSGFMTAVSLKTSQFIA